MPKSVSCDTCEGKVVRPRGFLLTTTAVVGSSKFWRGYCQQHAQMLLALGISSFSEFRKNATVRDETVRMLAAQQSGWIVCESCIEKFSVDTDKCAAYAKKWWNDQNFLPPGSGAAPLSAVNLGSRASKKKQQQKPGNRQIDAVAVCPECEIQFPSKVGKTTCPDCGNSFKLHVSSILRLEAPVLTKRAICCQKCERLLPQKTGEEDNCPHCGAYLSKERAVEQDEWPLTVGAVMLQLSPEHPSRALWGIVAIILGVSALIVYLTAA